MAEMSGLAKKEFAQRFYNIFQKLAELRHLPADSKVAQKAIHEWYLILNEMVDYSLETFKALGQMYVDDIRFLKNIDRYGVGLARFMRDAMVFYADINYQRC